MNWTLLMQEKVNEYPELEDEGGDLHHDSLDLVHPQLLRTCVPQCSNVRFGLHQSVTLPKLIDYFLDRL